MTGCCWVHLPSICLKYIWSRVYSYHVPSFLAAANSERPFGITVRVEKIAWITAMKTALFRLIHKLAWRMPCSWSWLSHLSSAFSSATYRATSLWYLQPPKLGSWSAVCVSVESFWVDELRHGRGCQMRWWWWLKRLGLRECFLAEVQLRQYRVFDHGTLDTLPSVCNEIGLLRYFAFNFTFAYSTSFLFYKLCCILFVPL